MIDFMSPNKLITTVSDLKYDKDVFTYFTLNVSFSPCLDLCEI